MRIYSCCYVALSGVIVRQVTYYKTLVECVHNMKDVPNQSILQSDYMYPKLLPRIVSYGRGLQFPVPRPTFCQLYCNYIIVLGAWHATRNTSALHWQRQISCTQIHESVSHLLAAQTLQSRIQSVSSIVSIEPVDTIVCCCRLVFKVRYYNDILFSVTKLCRETQHS